MKLVLGLLLAPVGLVLLDLYIAGIIRIAYRIVTYLRGRVSWLP